MQFSQNMDNKKRIVIFAALIVLVTLIGLAVAGVFGGSKKNVAAVRLRCVASQDVTPFGSDILYYDGVTLYCLRSNGYEKWSYPLGENASFTCSDSVVAAWMGTQLHIVDRDGKTTYNENLPNVIQFARVGAKYVAAVTGSDTSPTLVVKDMQGTTVDQESSAYEDTIILDMGFFSDGEYLWTTSMDVYGSVPDTTLHTFRVHVSNSGGISLGENLVYSVVYAGTKLNVISTRRLRQYDYRGTQDESGTVLVYGWQLVDSVVSGAEAMLLFSPASTNDYLGRINQLRLIWGKTDRRYALPGECVGAGLYNKRIYAFGEDMIYRADLGSRRFTPISISSMINGQTVTGFLGILKNGVALISCSNEVYAVTLI
ncbi:MAG: hypothetical protein IKH57_19160 [Clostridia bacterium]|nr:hypothetical protein [Clostridia bacterium]